MDTNRPVAIVFGSVWFLLGFALVVGAGRFQHFAIAFYKRYPHARLPLGESLLNGPGFVWAARVVGILMLGIGLYLLGIAFR